MYNKKVSPPKARLTKKEKEFFRTRADGKAKKSDVESFIKGFTKAFDAKLPKVGG